MLNDIQKSILQTVSDMTSIPDGAVNIRLDGQKEFRQNTKNIQIVSKTDKDGIDINIAPFTSPSFSANPASTILSITTSISARAQMSPSSPAAAFTTAAAATRSMMGFTRSTSARTQRFTTLRSTMARAKAPASVF